ncbi:MAG: cupin domain-containing protein [Thaumarchaeota archaeon]|nr:cupin domain-containing protein [Nitrososphaerota archaeon]
MAVPSEERYRILLEFSAKEREKWSNSKLITRKEELRFEKTRQGTTAQVVNPLMGFNVKTIGAFIREISPGKKGGKHRHRMEAIIHVLSGQGYSIIDDRKIEWKEGDTLCIPPWSWHQHFNTDTRPAKLFAATSIPLMMNLGLLDWEQAENADF